MAAARSSLLRPAAMTGAATAESASTAGLSVSIRLAAEEWQSGQTVAARGSARRSDAAVQLFAQGYERACGMRYRADLESSPNELCSGSLIWPGWVERVLLPLAGQVPRRNCQTWPLACAQDRFSSSSLSPPALHGCRLVAAEDTVGGYRRRHAAGGGDGCRRVARWSGCLSRRVRGASLRGWCA